MTQYHWCAWLILFHLIAPPLLGVALNDPAISPSIYLSFSCRQLNGATCDSPMAAMNHFRRMCLDYLTAISRVGSAYHFAAILFLQFRCFLCHLTSSFKALKRNSHNYMYISGVTIGHARRAVHAGPALWGGPKFARRCFLKVFLGKRGPFWNTCTRAHCNLVTPLMYICKTQMHVTK